MTSARRDRIERLAYLKAEAAGFPTGQEVRFWLEAEAEDDQKAREWAKTPKDLYSAFMERFFESADRVGATAVYNAPPGARYSSEKPLIGQEYIRAVHERRSMIESICSIEWRNTWGIFDVSLLADASDIDELAKRSLLMSDTTLIGSSSDEFQEGVPYKDTTNPLDPYGLYSGIDIEANIKEEPLGVWLDTFRPQLIQGTMFCLPRTRERRFIQCAEPFPPGPESGLYDAVLRNGKVKMFASRNEAKQRFIKVLAEVPLPYVQTTSSKVFSEVFCDEIDAANSLKRALRERFFELDAAKASVRSETQFLRLANSLAREARAACSDLERLNKRRTIQASGVLIGTGVAVLAALNTELLANAATLLGGAGGLAALLKLLQEQADLKRECAANPYVFLWLLKRRQASNKGINRPRHDRR